MPAEPTVPVDACSISGPNGTRIPTEEPHAWVSRKGPDNIWVRTCQLCPAIDWDDLREGMLAFAAATFKETAENLNVAPDVQGKENQATVPASMGGPLSEADRLAKIRRRVEHAKVVTANAPNTFWHNFVEDAAHLLSLVDAAEERTVEITRAGQIVDICWGERRRMKIAAMSLLGGDGYAATIHLQDAQALGLDGGDPNAA